MKLNRYVYNTSNYNTSLFSVLLILLSTLFNQTAFANKTLLLENDRFTVERNGRYFIIELNQAHQVLSTSNINGGQQTEVRYLVNHQSLEASGHDDQFAKIIKQSDKEGHQEVAEAVKLDAIIY